MTPLVSIIIPVYNAEKYILEAIDCILEQTYKNFEIIVVNDGSTDNTIKALSTYQQHIRLISQSNRGPSKARNVGIAVSKGKYIAFLDADDLWTPNKLRIQIDFLEKHSDIDLIFADALIFNSKGVLIPSYFKSIKDKSIFQKLLKEGDEIKDPTLMLLKCNVIPTGTVIIRKRCLEKSKLFDENISTVEDLDLWLRISLNSKIACIPEILKKKRHHTTNISHDDFEAAKASIYFIEKLMKESSCFRKKYGGLARERLSNDYFDLGYQCFSKKSMKTARKFFWKSFYIRKNFNSILYYFCSFLPIIIIRYLKNVKDAFRF